jgi:uncharacterized membrane protein YkoI
MNKTLSTLVIAIGLSPLAAGVLSAQQPAPRNPNAPSISFSRARAIALRLVPNNEGIRSEKLKTRDGILVYEFDIEKAGAGHQEIRVNARTGGIVANKHEDDLVGDKTNKVAKATEKAANKAAKATEKAANKTARAAEKAADKVFGDDDIRNVRPNISEARARAIAQARVPNGRIEESDLETENGYLVWEIDLDTPGSGGQELLIDAMSGTILQQKQN